MGYDLPAALGACLESNSRNVICLTGDGSIMMNLQELETIKFNKFPIKIFIINNAGYSSIKQTQRNFFDGHLIGAGSSSGVGMPDFSKIAKAFKIKGLTIKNPEEIESKIEETLKSKEAIICEVITEKEYNFVPKLSSKKLPDGTMVSPNLGDVCPFLRKMRLKCLKIY
jgi:acetolactate synthase-1/2/3 large subunit